MEEATCVDVPQVDCPVLWHRAKQRLLDRIKLQLSYCLQYANINNNICLENFTVFFKVFTSILFIIDNLRSFTEQELYKYTHLDFWGSHWSATLSCHYIIHNYLPCLRSGSDMGIVGIKTYTTDWTFVVLQKKYHINEQCNRYWYCLIKCRDSRNMKLINDGMWLMRNTLYDFLMVLDFRSQALMIPSEPPTTRYLDVDVRSTHNLPG